MTKVQGELGFGNGAATKVCKKCGVEKEIEAFAKDKRCPGGRTARCRDCIAPSKAAWQGKRFATMRELPLSEKVTVATKVCKSCGVERPAGEFEHEARTNDGLTAKCRVCIRPFRAKWANDATKRRTKTRVEENLKITSWECNKCGIVKPIAEFPPLLPSKTYEVHKCIECRKPPRNPRPVRVAKETVKREVVKIGEYARSVALKCIACGTSKPMRLFPVVAGAPWGRGDKCNSCESIAKRRREKEAKDAANGVVMEGTRRCYRCKQEKPITEFLSDVSKSRGRSHDCRDCSSEYQKAYRDKHKTENDLRKRHSYALKNKFNITIEEYEAMYERQGGKCSMCGVHASTLSRRLCVDHDHITGKIRSLSCVPCNAGLGNFKESIALLYKAIEYLEFHNGATHEASVST